MDGWAIALIGALYGVGFTLVLLYAISMVPVGSPRWWTFFEGLLVALFWPATLPVMALIWAGRER